MLQFDLEGSGLDEYKFTKCVIMLKLGQRLREFRSLENIISQDARSNAQLTKETSLYSFSVSAVWVSAMKQPIKAPQQGFCFASILA